ncbi:hypothetical protein LINGRAHAP2_LOCUS25504 [Linum grandiflorum]
MERRKIPGKPWRSSQPTMEAIERKKNRWCVTYTKHIKQKRKVYQDGFLDHFIITNKVTTITQLSISAQFLSFRNPSFWSPSLFNFRFRIYRDGSDCLLNSLQVVLFDESEKLLECKVLKDEDIVSSGESLTFNSYLVDVGDPEGAHAPVPGRDKKKQERVPGLMHRQKFRSPSISSEFRKSELQKYEAPKNAKDTGKLGRTEWQVLYTTQVSKKAKAYHDGFLRVANCGSLQRQIMLYDTSRKLLTSRFLKKDEIVASNGSLSMDGHLVDIGEAVEDRSPLVNVPDDQSKNTNMMHERQNGSKSRPVYVEDVKWSDDQKLEEAVLSANKTTHTTTEWEVMYTSQMTQKAKKYHDGFLKLEIRGSLGRQVKLYDASWNVLESRHLKKDEQISSGRSIAFGAHLVDVGELKGDNQLREDSYAPGNDSNTGHKPDRVQDARLRSDNYNAKANSQVHEFPKVYSNSSSLINPERIKFVETVTIKQPLRDGCLNWNGFSTIVMVGIGLAASQILSILKKPPQKSGAAAGCINENQKTLVSPNQVLQASPKRASKLFSNEVASENLTDASGKRSRLPSGTEDSHSSQKCDLGMQDTRSSDEDFPPTSETAVTRDGGADGESDNCQQLNTESEELPSFDLGF